MHAVRQSTSSWASTLLTSTVDSLVDCKHPHSNSCTVICTPILGAFTWSAWQAIQHHPGSMHYHAAVTAMMYTCKAQVLHITPFGKTCCKSAGSLTERLQLPLHDCDNYVSAHHHFIVKQAEAARWESKLMLHCLPLV